MLIPRFHNRVGKVCALLAATLVLPALASANPNGTNQNGNPQNVSPVPEANAGWVLIPFFGAVLFFSARQLLRGKATE
jgi:hypothetical protein